MRTGMLVLAAVFAVASAVCADLVELQERARNALLMRQHIYSHVTTPGSKTWAERELRQRRRKRGGLSRLPGGKLPQSGSAEKDLPKDALRVSWSVSDSDDGYYDSSASSGSLRDIPDIAVNVADALQDFSDSAVQLIINLRLLLGRTHVIAVTGAVSKRAAQESQHARKSRKKKKHDNESEARRALEREKASKNIKRVVTSVFRIGIGLVIGWLLWLLVRSSFR